MLFTVTIFHTKLGDAKPKAEGAIASLLQRGTATEDGALKQ